MSDATHKEERESLLQAMWWEISI